MRGREKFSRRRFLEGLSAGAALLPLLEDDLARAGCLPAGRKRLVVVNWGNGLQQRAQGADTSFTLPFIMKGLEPHRADLLIPDALSNKAFHDVWPKQINNEAHQSPASVLVGTRLMLDAKGYPSPGATTPSVDRFIGNALKQRSGAPFAALNLGVKLQGANEVGACGITTWQAPSVPAAPDEDPYHAFDQVFAGRMMGAGTPQMDTVRAMRKSVLDYVQKDIARFRANLGARDRIAIDGHLPSIRDIESRLTSQPQIASGCPIPALGARYDVQSSDNFEKVLRAHMDIAVAALAAGSTQVATIQASNGAGGRVILTWLGLQPTGMIDKNASGGDTNSHHSVAHSGGARKDLVDSWFFDQVAYLIAKLKAEREGASSIFDNSVVLVTNNMNNGASHSTSDMPWLVAGSAGGYFKTGRLLKAGNASHTQLLVGICNAFGVSADGFADPAYGGELPGLRG